MIKGKKDDPALQSFLRLLFGSYILKNGWQHLASTVQKLIPRQDWQHECALSPTSAEAIPKVNVIPTLTVIPKGFFFIGLPEPIHPLTLLVASFLSWKIHGQVHSGETSWSNLQGFQPHLSILYTAVNVGEHHPKSRGSKPERVKSPCTTTGSLQTGHLSPRGQHRCWLPAACSVSSSSPLSLYIWLNWSQSKCYNLQPSILRDTNIYFRLLKMFLWCHYWD